MWKRTISLSAIALLASAGQALIAQQPAPQPPVAQQPAPQQHEPARCSRLSPLSVWSQVDWLRLEISGGRIAVTTTRCGQTRVATEPAEGSQRRQTLTVDSQPGVLLTTFELCDERATLKLQIDARKQLTITRQGVTGSGLPEVQYIQPQSGPVQLVIGGDQPRKFTAPSLWHLLLVEAEASRKHLEPLLTQIQPSWRLPQQLAEIEAALAAQAGTEVSAQRRQWQTWVDQLSDDSFARRSEADRSLRSTGQSVLAFLRQLDAATLDLEQRRRIRGILATVADPGSDSPERVAAWLADDKRVWLALLASGPADQRLAAARHLSKMSGRSVSFDPAASADQRAEQLVQLQALLADQ